MKGIKTSLLLVFILFFCSNAYAKSTVIELKKMYQNWCDAINTAKGNPQKIVKYYAPDAILLPTLSSEVLFNTNKGLDDYFTVLTSYPDIKCTTQKLITRLYGDLVGVNAGLYTFTYFDKKSDKNITLLARFTFVYEKLGNQWLIVSHHSSLRP